MSNHLEITKVSRCDFTGDVKLVCATLSSAAVSDPVASDLYVDDANMGELYTGMLSV